MAQAAQANADSCTSNIGCFSVGDIVDVKGHGRASVIEPLEQLPDSPHFGRYLVRYHEDGTTYWCRPKLMRRMYPTDKRVLVARSTAAYRDALVHNVDRPDVCLEIGCHEGLTTNIISNRASFVTGVDTAAEVVVIARRRHPHLAFHQLDGLDVAATAALSPTGTYTRICIDISGKAPLELICQMIAVQRSAFPAASLIVKNEQLFDALLARQQPQLVQRHDPPFRGPEAHCNMHNNTNNNHGRQEHTHQAAAPPPLSLTRDEYMTCMRATARRSLQPQHRDAAGPSSGGDGGEGVAARGGTPSAKPPPTTATSSAATTSATTTPTPASDAPGEGGAEGEAEGGPAGCRLEVLLGEALLADCELFRHQSQPPRTRPHRRQSKGKDSAVAGEREISSLRPLS
ncbi:hypothetical protein PLESTF_000409100 [Pleodorina starrii]|nr:hypothetical protein PLESTM_001450600 [Pleodorina starrii]GLC66299.1 hypothetical protein PLESTF_000409100 [Pleodorina starrii]